MPPFSRRSALTALAGASLVPVTPVEAASTKSRHGPWKALAADVRAEMAWAWQGYADRAWGADQIKPVSGGKESFFFEGGPSLGLTIVEALDTLWLMGLDGEFEQGVRWVCDHLSFDHDRDIQVFETNIRLVGGLLSAWKAGGEKKLLALAKDLADRLMPAFAKSPTGLPYRFVNLRTGAARDKLTYPAEFGTYIAEFGTLSQATGEKRWHDAAKRAVVAGFEGGSKIGLVADTIDVETGAWASRRASIGPPTDSYFEYLWDGWQLFGDRDFKRMYDVHAKAILTYQSEHAHGHLWFRQVDFETGALLDRHQSELASFWAGQLAQGGAKRAGADYLASWAAVQERFGVLPEGYDFGTETATRKTNDLRPEFVDSCLNLWLLDRNDHWRDLAATHYRNMKAASRAKYGYTVLTDVTVQPAAQGDFCPGYWWSEQMKYYWLLFSDTPRFDYRNNYLSTEGNVFVGFKR